MERGEPRKRRQETEVSEFCVWFEMIFESGGAIDCQHIMGDPSLISRQVGTQLVLVTSASSPGVAERPGTCRSSCHTVGGA